MKYLALAVLTSSLALYSMENQEESSEDNFEIFASSGTVRGIPITDKNILELLPEAPEEVKKQVQDFLTANPDVAAVMSGQEAFEGDNPVITQDDVGRRNYYLCTQMRLNNAGLKNLSKSSNTVVAIGTVIVKASSLANRHKNIGTGVFKMPYGSKISPEQFKEFKEKHGVKTFQTGSRGAYLVVAKDVCDKLKLDMLTFPNKYFIHIPGRPTEFADTNYVIAEERVQNVVADLQEHPMALDVKSMQQLVKLCAGTGLWNHVASAGNIFVVKDPTTKKLHLCYHDTEQPNVHSPKDFFHKNPEVHFSNVRHGWSELKNQVILVYLARLNTSIDKTTLTKDEKTFLMNLAREQVAEGSSLPEEQKAILRSFVGDTSDTLTLTDEQKIVLKNIVGGHVIKLLSEKHKLETRIAAHFPKEYQ